MNRLSRAVDFGSAVLFAGAAGYSAMILSASPIAGAAAAVIAFAGAQWTLSMIDTPRFDLPSFEAAGLALEPDELLLTELAELLLTETVSAGTDELLFDDQLGRPTPDSRVIRLFDPRLLPPAGEPHDRTEHRVQGLRPSTFPDATRELHEALAELRRSLR